MHALILIVDDEPEVVGALECALHGEGYEIITATSGREALDLVRDQPVDIIISDEQMPGMSGVEFLKHARIMRPEALRILLTGHGDLETAMRAINDDAVYRFLLKPCDSYDLKVVLRLAVRHLEVLKENHALKAELVTRDRRIRELERSLTKG